jgi:hypothetical protein
MSGHLTLPEYLWSFKYQDLQNNLENQLNKASSSVQELQYFKDQEENIINQWSTLLDFFWQSLEGTKSQMNLYSPDSREFISFDTYYCRLQNSINFYSYAIEIRKEILRKCDNLLKTIPVLRIVFEKRIQSKTTVKDSQTFFVEYL